MKVEVIVISVGLAIITLVTYATVNPQTSPIVALKDFNMPECRDWCITHKFDSKYDIKECVTICQIRKDLKEEIYDK